MALPLLCPSEMAQTMRSCDLRRSEGVYADERKTFCAAIIPLKIQSLEENGLKLGAFP